MNISQKPVVRAVCPPGSKIFQPTGAGRLWIQWSLSGPAWNATLKQVQSLKGEKKYDAVNKFWDAKDTTETRQALIACGFVLHGSAAPTPIAMPSGSPKREITPWTPPWKGLQLPGSWDHLREYQHEGLQMLEYRKGVGMLAMDPGLGKTATSLSFVRMHPEMDRIVVLTTAATKHQWKVEAKKWGLSLTTWLLSGKTPSRLPDRGIVAINWEILPPDQLAKAKKDPLTGKPIPQKVRTLFPGWLDALLSWNPHTVIADEFHLHVGDPTSQRSKALVKLVQGRGFIPMSGSPMRTHVRQLWVVLHQLDPVTFSDRWKFLNRYCGPKMGAYGMTFDGASNTVELYEKIRPLCIRYQKEDVLQDLPDRIYNPVMLDCKVSDEYTEAQNKFLKLQGLPADEMLRKLEALSHSAFLEKREAVLEWISDFLESGRKLTILCWHVAVADYLEASLGKRCARLTDKDRPGTINRFIKDPECKVFLGNIQAAGTGVDGLQHVCQDLAFVEFCGSPSDMDQGSSRLHRLGQKECVSVHFLIAPGTIDSVRLSVLSAREKDMATVVDGQIEFDGTESIVSMVQGLALQTSNEKGTK